MQSSLTINVLVNQKKRNNTVRRKKKRTKEGKETKNEFEM
jgi:hypothetical protein